MQTFPKIVKDDSNIDIVKQSLVRVNGREVREILFDGVEEQIEGSTVSIKLPEQKEFPDINKIIEFEYKKILHDIDRIKKELLNSVSNSLEDYNNLYKIENYKFITDVNQSVNQKLEDLRLNIENYKNSITEENRKNIEEYKNYLSKLDNIENLTDIVNYKIDKITEYEIPTPEVDAEPIYTIIREGVDTFSSLVSRVEDEIKNIDVNPVVNIPPFPEQKDYSNSLKDIRKDIQVICENQLLITSNIKELKDKISDDIKLQAVQIKDNKEILEKIISESMKNLNEIHSSKTYETNSLCLNINKSMLFLYWIVGFDLIVNIFSIFLR
jgi:hypothetical protein